MEYSLLQEYLDGTIDLQNLLHSMYEETINLNKIYTAPKSYSYIQRAQKEILKLKSDLEERNRI
ncbi:MAG: hypothetical protein IKV94_00200 [Clostridia bacterium]|nr:hypothetical protein [Clostridia bacterium]